MNIHGYNEYPWEGTCDWVVFAHETGVMVS